MTEIKRTIEGGLYKTDDIGNVYHCDALLCDYHQVLSNQGRVVGNDWHADTVAAAHSVLKEWLALRQNEQQAPTANDDHLLEPWSNWLRDIDAHRNDPSSPTESTLLNVAREMIIEIGARQRPAAEANLWRADNATTTDESLRDAQYARQSAPVDGGLPVQYYDGYSTPNTVVIAHQHTQATICTIGCDSDAQAVRYGLALWGRKQAGG